MQSSTKARAEGKMPQAQGKIKETVGKAVGNEDLEVKGNIEHSRGKVQERIGKHKKVAGN